MSKAAVNHLIRELAIGLGPLVRVNGIAPATVVAGSSMFPRDRVVASLRKYDLVAGEEESIEALRMRLAEFYAKRTITRRPILPIDCANAICWLAGISARRRPVTSCRSMEACPMRSSGDTNADLVERVGRALDRLRIELPSWGFANTGTRFGKFLQHRSRDHGREDHRRRDSYIN